MGAVGPNEVTGSLLEERSYIDDKTLCFPETLRTDAPIFMKHLSLHNSTPTEGELMTNFSFK